MLLGSSDLFGLEPIFTDGGFGDLIGGVEWILRLWSSLVADDSYKGVTRTGLLVC